MIKKALMISSVILCSLLLMSKVKALENSVIIDYSSKNVQTHIEQNDIESKAKYLMDYVDRNVLGKLHDGSNHIYTDYLISIDSKTMEIYFVRDSLLPIFYNRFENDNYGPVTLNGTYQRFSFSLNNTLEDFKIMVDNFNFVNWYSVGQSSLLGLKTSAIGKEWNSQGRITFLYYSSFDIFVDDRNLYDIVIDNVHYNSSIPFPTYSTVLKPPFQYVTGFSSNGEDTSLELSKINFESSFNSLIDTLGVKQDYDIRFQYIDYSDSILPNFLGYNILFKNKYTNLWENVKDINFTDFDTGNEYSASDLFTVTYSYDELKQFLDFNIVSNINFNPVDYNDFKIEFCFDNTLYTDINVFQNYIFGNFYRSDLLMDGYVRYFFKDADYNAFLSSDRDVEFRLYVPGNSIINDDINLGLYSYDFTTKDIVNNYISYLADSNYPGYDSVDLTLDFSKNLIYVIQKSTGSSLYFYVPDYISVSFFGEKEKENIVINTPNGTIELDPGSNIGKPSEDVTSLNGIFDNVYSFLNQLKKYSDIWNLVFDKFFTSLPFFLYGFIVTIFILINVSFLLKLGGWK